MGATTIAATTGVAAALSIAYLVFSRWRRQERSDGPLSRRAKVLTMPALPYFPGVMKGFTSPYDAKENPDGYILLAVAENKLCWSDLLRSRISRFMDLELPDGLPQPATNYTSLEGSPALCGAVAHFLRRKIYQEDPLEPCFEVPSSEIVCTAGVTAALSNLFYCICEPGDYVLIPAPYYSAFDNDLRAFAGVEREPVPLKAENGYRLTSEMLEEAYCACARRPRALLLTNPHNPLGTIMSEEDLKKVVEWCDSKPDFHLISDEIYALSCFKGREFVSVAHIVQGDLAAHRTHIVWGLSKDFGLSGFRVGVVWTGDSSVRAALTSANLFSPVSGYTSQLVVAMLSDLPWCTAYLKENAMRLEESCRICQDKLDQLAIPYVPPQSGMFILIDMSRIVQVYAQKHGKVDEDPWIAEDLVYNALIDVHRIIFTPGSSQHCEKPGWFRICYAFVEPATLKVAMDNLAAFVGGLVEETAATLS